MLWKENGRFSLVTGRDWSPLCLNHWSGDISSLLASCSAFVGDFSARYLPLQQLKLIENYILLYGNWYIILIVKYGVAKNVNTQVEVQTPQSKCTFQTHTFCKCHISREQCVRFFLKSLNYVTSVSTVFLGRRVAAELWWWATCEVNQRASRRRERETDGRFLSEAP